MRELFKAPPKDLFVAVRERLRLAKLREFTTEELTAEINRRNQGQIREVPSEETQ